MTATVGRIGRPNGQGVADGRRFELRPKRSGKQMAIGALAVFLGALLMYLAYVSLDDRTAVLAVADDVAAGDVIEAGDVRVVRVSTEGIEVVRATARDDIVGRRRAAVPLANGSLLAPSQVAAVGSDTAHLLVGVALSEDRMPAPLRIGDRVRLVDTGDRATPEEGPAVLVDDASVFAITKPESGDRTVVSVAVPADKATAVAAAAAYDRVTLVLLTARP